MPYKLCPNCNQASYSTNGRGVWECPYCGSDITFVLGTVEHPKEDEEKNNRKKISRVHLRLVDN